MTTPLPYRQRLESRMIDIAERLVVTEGLTSVQARRVAQEADCSVGTLYNIFGGLDGLIITVNTRTIEILGDTLQAALNVVANDDLEHRLTALALAYRDFASRQDTRWRALFEHRMEAGKTVPDAYRQKQAVLFDLVEHTLARQIARPLERSTAARALFSAVHGILWLAHDNKLGALDHTETERQIRFVVSAVALGILRAGGTRQRSPQ
jgi:AcrR family transcriptional regulator